MGMSGMDRQSVSRVSSKSFSKTAWYSWSGPKRASAKIWIIIMAKTVLPRVNVGLSLENLFDSRSRW